MEIRVLGPVEVEAGGRLLDPGAPRQRALLALLALNANSTVSVDRLIEGLWSDEQPPPTAGKMVQIHVSQLRRLLAGDSGAEIVTRGRGYELRVEPGTVDAARFERLVAQAASHEEDGETGRLARAALGLWRGPPLADLHDEPFVPAEARRLEELRLAATELAIEDELQQGRHLEAVAELESLVAEHPLRERLHGLLMLALYRAGRQAEALEAYRKARSVLVEEIGVEPGPELRRLHEAILRQDRTLELSVPNAGWARRQTAERVGASAGSAATHRGELRREEDRLTEDLVDLQALREAMASGVTGELHRLPGALEGSAVHPVCPFKGLASFDMADAEFFFGRERLVAEVVARLVGATLLGIVGPSGSGKSSTLRAGLLPALADGVLPGSERWRAVVVRPGDRPMAALRRALAPATEEDVFARAIAALGPGERLVLAVDQFEETFTVCRQATERDAFVRALVTAADRDDGRILVVVALRADFYGACAEYPRLARRLSDAHVLVGPMEPDELARAIEGPASRAGLELEAGLVGRLVDDVAGRPGGLPLLSTALLELWQQRDGRRLRLAAYERSGGVRGAVARLAEKAYAGLGDAEQRIARRILLRLAGPGRTEAVVRRRVSLPELEVDTDEQAFRVLEALAHSRLVTVDDDAAEVAHEALLREWPRLRGWLEEDAEGRRLQGHITSAAQEWDAGGRDPGELYRGARLASALDWAAARGEELNRLERKFLEAGRLQSEEQSRRARAANRRLRALLVASIVGLVLASAAGLAALDQRGDARRTALVADAQRLGAQALTEERTDRALLLARVGVALDDSAVTRGNLLSVLVRSPPAALGILRPSVSDPQVFAVATSPNGRLLATGDAAGTVALFDAGSRRRLGEYAVGDRGPASGLVQALRFSPDGATLAVTGQLPMDEPTGGIVDLVDARTLERRHRVVLPPYPEPAPFAVITAVFLPDGRDLLVSQATGAFAEGSPNVLRRLDGRTGEIERGPLRPARHATQAVIPFPGRHRVLMTSPRETYAVDSRSLRLTRTYPVGGFTGALSPDGATLAVGSDDGSVQLLDLRSGRVRRLASRHDGRIVRMLVTPDGRTLVSSDDSGTVLVWNLAAGTVREKLAGHTDAVFGLAASPDGRTLYSAGDDASVITWDLTGRRRMVRRFPLGPEFGDIDTPRGIAVSPDGRTVAYTHFDGSVDLVDTRTLRRRDRLRALRGFAAGVAFSPDGRLLAVTGEGGQLGLWDARTLEPLSTRLGLAATSQAVAFSPDGRRLIAAEVDTPAPRLVVWNVADELPGDELSRTAAASLAFNPDGTLIAAAALEKGTEIRDSRTGKLVRRLRGDGHSRSVAFSRDGTLLAVGEYEGHAHLYSARDWEPVGRVMDGHSQRVTFVDFSPDGRALATASADGTVALWDVATQEPLGSPIVMQADTFASLAFSRKGSTLFAVSTAGRGLRLETAPAVWTRRACLVAGRDLTEREWQDVLPAVPYRPVCARN